MIETRVDTMIRSAESIGGGLYPAELAKRNKKSREAKDPDTARYCENPQCWAIEQDGKPQRLSTYNYFVVDKGAYTGKEYSRFCGACTRRMLDEALEQEHPVGTETQKECNRGHDLTVPGAYSDGRCKQCKNQQRRLPRWSHRADYIDLPGLETAKHKWGGTWVTLGKACGYNHNTIKSWAYLTSGAPEEATEKLARALGCTEAELLSEAGEAAWAS